MKKSIKVSKNAEFHAFSMKFCVFFISFRIFSKNICFQVILVLFQTLKSNAQKTALKIKKRIKKCVLDLNFAPIKGSEFLIFLTKVKFVVPQCALCICTVYSTYWQSGLGFVWTIKRRLDEIQLFNCQKTTAFTLLNYSVAPFLTVLHNCEVMLFCPLGRRGVVEET